MDDLKEIWTKGGSYTIPKGKKLTVWSIDGFETQEVKASELKDSDEILYEGVDQNYEKIYGIKKDKKSE